MRKGPCSAPRNPAVWNAFTAALSAPISRFWPIEMNAGTVGFLGPSVFETTAPRWGMAIGCGGM